MPWFKDFLNTVTCNCTKSNDGTSTVTISIKDGCCNKKKIVIHMGSMDSSNVESLVRTISKHNINGPVCSEGSV